jgi:hypothetical protein
MNPQTPLPAQPGGERPLVPGSEHLAAAPEQAAPLEAAPSSAAASPAVASVPVQLTAQDVAAAISQMPATEAVVPSTLPIAPATALDQDVIEPEWVDQAEAVIVKTAGDPHAEEEAVEALQIDYLQKRYGHTVKNPDQTA